MPFEDVTLVQQAGTTCTRNLFSLSIKQFRETSPRVHFRFRCTTQNDNDRYTLTNNDKSILKNVDGWNCAWVSDIPLDKQKSYFEVVFADRSKSGSCTGVYVGVTDNITIVSAEYYPIDITTVCALFNSESGNRGSGDSLATVRVSRNARTQTNDIVGVVVDRIQDRILFYLNRVLIGEGLRKPSQFGTLYAFVSTYFASEIISLAEVYDMRELLEKGA